MKTRNECLTYPVLITTLGCDKNRVDAERMLSALRDAGFTITDEEDTAKAAVVNTCCFINDAKEESIAELLALAERRKDGTLDALIVTGCMADRYRVEIQKEIPEVDAVVRVAEEETIAKVLRTCLFLSDGASADTATAVKSARTLTTAGYAYLKIAEGCDKHCTYCIIPKIRGAYRSVPIEELVEEAKELVSMGAQELLLVAQETTLYGTDLYGEKRLPDLLNALCDIEDLKWIRLLYCYPEEITDELIDVMRNQPKVLHYIDMPVQSGSDSVLRRMGRRTTSGEIRQIVARLRLAIPDICIRTTLISGFPGETTQEARETYEFVKEMRFDRLGVFAYSQEEDTPAFAMPDQVSEPKKKMRRTRLMKLQQEIALEAARRMKGKILDAMIEGYLPEEDCFVARTYKDMPEVDGLLFLQRDEDTPTELLSGTIVRARITGANDYDLLGVFAKEREHK